MRLTHIKLAGFKSFVDPTVISFPGDLVGIVGPNGCGKSNVIDAIRWVLGESKASALRGESMQDVIFSGSANRKPISRASVELAFDNKLGKAAGQWSSYAEISIKRVVHRDGDSVYSINNTRVRRRDVADIFLGTGVSGKGYAIIEQGMISRIIEAKPQELRVFLEEAAGISKYRLRRHETELRLADTERNLLRVEDICQELNKRSEHLEAQAEVAHQYNALQEKLLTTQNLLWLTCKQQAIEQRSLATKKIQQLELELEAEITFLHNTDKSLEDTRSQHYAAGDAQHLAQGELYAANAEITRIEQEMQHLRDNARRMTEQITEIEKQLELNSEQKHDAASNLDHWRRETETASLAHESSKQKNALEREKLPIAEADSRSGQEKLNVCQRDLLLVEQSLHLEQNHLTHADKSCQQLTSRQLHLEQELERLPQPDHESLSHLQLESKDLQTTLLQKKIIFSQTEEQLTAAIKSKDQLARKVEVFQLKLTQIEARFDTLQQLQHQLESNQALNTWLAKYQLESLPRLWQNIQIEKGWEKALEAILRERLNSTEFGQLDKMQDWLNDLPPGKWTILESANLPTPQASAKIRKQAPDNLSNSRPLREYLTCSNPQLMSVLDDWLDKIYAVENIQAGLLQKNELAVGEMLITREGHLFTRYSLTFYAPDSQLDGVLTRQQELNQISMEIKKLKITLNDEQSELIVEQQTCHKLIEAVTLLRQENEKSQQQQHDSQMQLIKLSQLAEQTDQRRNQIDSELKEIRRQLEIESSLKQNAQTKLAELKSQADKLNKQLQQQQAAREKSDQVLATQRQHTQDALTEMQQAAFHEKTCQNKISEIEQTVLVIDKGTDELTIKIDRLSTEKRNIDEIKLADKLPEYLSQRTKLEQVVIDTRIILKNATSALQETEKSRMASEQKLPPLREAISKAQLEEQAALITENRYAEQLVEVTANEEELLPKIDKMQPSDLQADIEQLNFEIKALGAVNLAALEELHKLTTRNTYLNSQLDDLKEAVTTLENVIRQMDVETRDRLQNTFNAVNENLSEIFPAIFGGGRAKLTLNSDEILDAGVQLIAQPPGKKTSSIHLLSGGEKALTALALVFALFKLNPAPFCLLDEVDAPLDDSNTERFCSLVKKMSKKTQFLFISHNKITMEMAQQLIGVTMQEQGVSRVVTVDIEEAIRLGTEAVVA